MLPLCVGETIHDGLARIAAGNSQIVAGDHFDALRAYHG